MSMDNLENQNNEIYQEFNDSSKKQNVWKLISIITATLSILLLFGIWYTNNERIFLRIENNSLSQQVKNLKDENNALLTKLAQEKTNKQDDDKDDKTEKQPEKTQQAKEDYSLYEVKPGDSLAKISILMYGTEIYADDIAKVNGLKLESLLQLGQKLKIPEKIGNQ